MGLPVTGVLTTALLTLVLAAAAPEDLLEFGIEIVLGAVGVGSGFVDELTGDGPELCAVLTGKLCAAPVVEAIVLGALAFVPASC